MGIWKTGTLHCTCWLSGDEVSTPELIYLIINSLLEIKISDRLYSYFKEYNWKFETEFEVTQIRLGIWALPFTTAFWVIFFFPPHWAPFLFLKWSLHYSWGEWLLGRSEMSQSMILSLEQHKWSVNRGDITALVVVVFRAFEGICFRINISVILWCLYSIILWCLYRCSTFHIFHSKWYCSSWTGIMLAISLKLNTLSEQGFFYHSEEFLSYRECTVRSLGCCKAQVPETFGAVADLYHNFPDCKV